MARFATADSQDHSPAVWILTLLTLIYTTLTTLVRAAIKFRMLGLDDGIAVFAQLLACGNAFSVIYALVHGLAREEPQDSEQRSRDGRLHYAGVSYTQTSVFILCAILTLTDTASEHRTLPFDIGGRESFHDLIPERIFRRSSHSHAMLICNTCVAILTLWGVVAAIAVSVDCGPEHMWSFPEDAACDGVVSVVCYIPHGKEMLTSLAGTMVGGHHYRRCNRDWRLSRCGLAGQPTADDSRKEGHCVRCFRMEARVSLLGRITVVP
jgi:hypothetical protein